MANRGDRADQTLIGSPLEIMGQHPQLATAEHTVLAAVERSGIIVVVWTGYPSRSPPKAHGCGSGTTSWRQLRDWQAPGVWERLHETLLN
jgi:transposase